MREPGGTPAAEAARKDALRLPRAIAPASVRFLMLAAEDGQLEIEQSTWGMPARVEKIARERGRMQLAPGSRIEIVETPKGGKGGDR